MQFSTISIQKTRHDNRKLKNVHQYNLLFPILQDTDKWIKKKQSEPFKNSYGQFFRMNWNWTLLQMIKSEYSKQGALKTDSYFELKS